MTPRQELITIAHIYCDARGISMARASTLALNTGTKLRRIEYENADIETRIWERAMTWFSDNWPDKIKWPNGIKRPARTILPVA